MPTSTIRKKPVAVLISGRGSNMTALLEAAKDPAYPAEIVLVLANKPDAKGLETAAAAGIATEVVDHKHYKGDREAFDAVIHEKLLAHGVELVALAGFMRILTPGFVEKWTDRMLNIHPSLLPSFKGLNTHQRTIDNGCRLAGCSVHFVRADMDSGPIICQAAVPVLDDDDEDSLADRILKAEHTIYPRALELVASGKTKVKNLRVEIDQSGAEPADETDQLIF